MKAVIVGTVESTRVAIRVAASQPGWSVAAVVTLPPNLSSRHSDFVDLAPDAERAGARLIRAPSSNAPDVIEEVRKFGADLVLVIGWSQICKRAFLQAAGGCAVGYHPAPLPRMRGRAAIPWTILLDERITASTLFWLDEGVDSGPILAQKFLHVAPDETATSLYARHLEALEAILIESLGAIARGEAPRIAQDERYATWTAKRAREDGRIDWSRPAAEVWRLVRAVGRPYPGAFTVHNGEDLVLWRAEPWAEAMRHAAQPGQVIAASAQGFAVSCGEGGLWVSEWAGARPKLHAILGRSS